jgi:hypothetical protein
VLRFREYQNIAIPAVCQGEPWTDESWHNDSCARAERPVVAGQDAEYPKLRLWVEADDEAEREYEDAPKFMLTLVADEWQEANGEDEILYVGGSEAEVEKIVAEVESGGTT